jgi:transposase
MPFLSRQKVGKYTYIYECEGYRIKIDGRSKSRSHRRPVGKVDLKTGKDVYYPEYIERMKAAGTPIVQDDDEPRFTVNDLKRSEVLEYGLTDLLSKLAEHSGLLESLRVSNPEYCAEIFTLASHFVASGEPFMHTQDWLESVEVTEPVGNLSSQRISKILADIPSSGIEGFFQKWAQKRTEIEYLALDITSTSSYSELIDDVEWGHNRDGEALPQVNLCVLMGETSRLPVYQTSYSGSINDVSTLKTTLKKFDTIVGNKPILIVMDKGFYSKANINDMLKNDSKFVVAVPFKLAFTRDLIKEFSGKIDTFEKNFVIGNDTVRVATKSRKQNGQTIYEHIYYNPTKAVRDREKMYVYVSELRDTALANPAKYADNKIYAKYLDIRLENEVYSVCVKEDEMENALKHAGWLVITSNHIASARDALRIYRAKDVVEKGFDRLKNSLDLDRLRVHSSTAMQSKYFIGFVALVMMMQIHNTMLDKELYKTMTMKELFRTLSKLRVQKIAGERIEFPKSKIVRQILDAFNLSC